MHRPLILKSPPGLGLMKLLFWAIYFVQKVSNNAEGLSKLPIVTQLKTATDKGGFAQPSESIGLFRADSSLGWYVKALFGPVVDNLPILGYRRKGWLMLSSALAAVAWGWVALFGQSTVALLFIGILFVNIFIALGDVICDGMMVEISQKMEADYKLEPGSINRQFQSSQWVGAMVAITLSAFGGGIIAQFFDLRSAALVSGLLPLLLIFLIASAVHEEKVLWDPLKARQGYKAIGILVVVTMIFVGFNRWHPDGLLDLTVPILKTGIVIGAMSLVVKIPRQLIVPAGFMLIWFVVPFNLDGGYCVNYFTQHSHAFIEQLRSDTMRPIWQILVTLNLSTQTDLDAMLAPGGSGLADLFYGSVVGTVGAIGGICGALFVGTSLKNVSLAKLFYLAVVLQFLQVMWIAATLATIGPLQLMLFAFVANFINLIVLLSALSWGANVIPNRDQAALYAFLMSMSNIGQQYGIDVIGGKVYDAFGGMTKVKDTVTGAESVVMQNADTGMQAVLVLSCGVLVCIAACVAFLQFTGHLGKRQAA